MCTQSRVWLKLWAKSSFSQARSKWNSVSFFTVISRCGRKIHGYLGKPDDEDYYFITNLSWRLRMCVSTQTKKLGQEEWKISNQVQEEVWVRPQKMQRCVLCYKPLWGGSSDQEWAHSTASPARALLLQQGRFLVPSLHALPTPPACPWWQGEMV